ncbi:MAG: ABC transporter substrate-binding protein [Marinilabiliales bacterium]|nr:MAG: ABC transporter substrate-binding protein [Marinilabiliales bacterium]
MKYYIIILLLFFIYSCSNESKQKSRSALDLPDSLTFEYAKGFEIKHQNNYKIVSVKNPWQGAKDVKYDYLLLNKNVPLPSVALNYEVIRTPVERVICLSTTHIAFIHVLNETESIVSISGTDYVNNPGVRQRIENNEIFDVGFDNSLNYELIASLEPDLVITYGIGGQIAGYNQKLNDLGIKTLIIAEYLEDHPLGKLEWIKLIAALYEKEELAQEYFDAKVLDYNSLAQLAKKEMMKPKILLGLPWKSTWYVPGGKSFLAKMISDAGGDYIWKENESRESLPLGIESVFAMASDANIWINTGTVNNKQDILKLDERFTDFAPFQESKIYNNNLQVNASGGNNYWEQGLVEPDILLKDLIKIFHPELLPKYKLVYYKIIE